MSDSTNNGQQSSSQPVPSEQRSPPRSPARSPKGSPRKSPKRSPSPRRSRSRSRSKTRGRSRSYSRSPRRKSRSRSYSRSPRSGRSGGRKRESTPPPPSKVLGIFGLSPSTTQKDLEEEFEKFGKLEKAELIIDKRTGRSRCFGFVYYGEQEDATKAKETCTGMKLHGRYIRIDYSKTQKPHEKTPGRYMGTVYSPPRDRRDRDRERDRDSRSYDRYDDRRDRDRDRDRDRYYDRRSDRYSPYRRPSPSRDYYYDRYYSGRY